LLTKRKRQTDNFQTDKFACENAMRVVQTAKIKKPTEEISLVTGGSNYVAPNRRFYIRVFPACHSVLII